MSGKKGTLNVRRGYRQSYLSGFEHIAQSTNQDSDSQKIKRLTDSPPKINKGQRSYSVSVQVIIEQVSNDSGLYTYRVLLNDDPNISVTPYSIRSKKETGQNVDLPKKGIKGGDSFSLVYGVHKGQHRTLSHTTQHPLPRVLPQIYSFILGAIDRAIECTILIPEDKATNDDSGKRAESTPTQESLGTDKEKRRSKKIRPEVLPEALPENSPLLVEIDGALLGSRQGNREVGLIQLGSGTDNGGAIANDLSNGQTPDIGF